MYLNLHANIKERTLPKTVHYELPHYYSEVVSAMFSSGAFKNSEQHDYYIEINALPVITVRDPELALYNSALVKALFDTGGSLMVAIIHSLRRIPEILDDITCLGIIADMYYQYKNSHAVSDMIRHH